MKKEDQVRFISQISTTLCKILTGRIETNQVPASWEEPELSQWFADFATHLLGGWTPTAKVPMKIPSSPKRSSHLTTLPLPNEKEKIQEG